MRVLITGGAGMVGRNLRRHPEAAAHEVLAPPREELDLADRAAVTRYLDEARPELVIHAAGRVGGIQANIAAPVRFLTDNLTIGQNVILGAWESGVTSLINLGSTCMYPRDGVNPLTEDQILSAPLEPTNEGYALAKIVAQRLCDYISREDADVRYKTLIPCNLYGPHDTFDPAASHLIPAILHKLHRAKTTGADIVEIWGDGTARREFMYVGDLADAVWRAAGDMSRVPDVMNVGLGRDYSINEYYEIGAQVVGWSGTFRHDLDRPVGMKRKLCSSRKAADWGWTASVPLTEGLERTYEHYLSEVAR
ncbi:GDP-L-fucose synthase [Roseovarius sp. SCSIO 43702]|uniref:GDP-L-fucose synthase family protein n=1 Tax=Roseovarius sp. SCSIO 43702 TaxID=2823043 RepID=UPI001C72EA50|nr:GDP-L-fucose synthase [Roseovarius sp. SCSIO 43702]QYX57164.1 GDP-L-fucose synthase [Roseovarius sp. SCSIO 43702]